MLILNLFFGKFTTRNAAAIPKRVMLLIVTASIGIPAKSSNTKPLKTTGTHIRERKLSSVRTQIAPAKAGAIMISDSNGGNRRL